MLAAPLDAGSDWFEPSTLQVTTIDVGNPASNVVPASARAVLNIRFNDRHIRRRWLAGCAPRSAHHAERFDIDVSVSGESFLTTPGPPVETLRDGSRRAATGRGAEARHRRRHIGRALHRALLPGGGVRPGGQPPCIRWTSACRWTNCARSPNLSRRAAGVRRMTPAGRRRRMSMRSAGGIARLAAFPGRRAGRVRRHAGRASERAGALAGVRSGRLRADAAGRFGGCGGRRIAGSAGRAADPAGGVARPSAVMAAAGDVAALRRGVHVVPVAEPVALVAALTFERHADGDGPAGKSRRS